MFNPVLEFVNHASIIVDAGLGLRLLMDPWLDGAVFNNGWSLLSPSVIREDDFATITDIWISHEHPDHFHPPSLRRIARQNGRQIRILFQYAPHLSASKEIQDFCKSLGFRDFLELPPDQHLALNSNLSIRCQHHMWGDSWCHLILSDGGGKKTWTLFNANDCEWYSEESAINVFAELGPIDVLLMQFSYACWYADRDARMAEANRLIDRLVMLTKLSGAKYVIPFASFFWFCHDENQEMNRDINTVQRVASAIATRTSAEPIILYPGDVWQIGKVINCQEALSRYANDYDIVGKAVTHSTKQFDLDDLQKKVATFWRGNYKSGHSAGADPDIVLFFRDLNCAGRWNADKLVPIQIRECDADLVLASDSFASVLETRWGADTLRISARFSIPKGSRYRDFSDLTLKVAQSLNPNAPLDRPLRFPPK